MPLPSPASRRKMRALEFLGKASIANEYKSLPFVCSQRQNSSARHMGCAEIFTNDTMISLNDLY